MAELVVSTPCTEGTPYLDAFPSPTACGECPLFPVAEELFSCRVLATVKAYHTARKQSAFDKLASMRSQENELKDALTGLPNRKGLLEMLRSIISVGESVAVFAVDMDDFKSINDTQGHPAGDKVLQRFAYASRELNIYAARTGGDEFVILIPQRSGGRHRYDSERRKSLHTQDEVDEESHRIMELFGDYGIAVSVGGTLHEHDEDPESVMERADAISLIAKSRRKAGKYPELSALERFAVDAAVLASGGDPTAPRRIASIATAKIASSTSKES